jgi:hypothetical protein
MDDTPPWACPEEKEEATCSGSRHLVRPRHPALLPAQWSQASGSSSCSLSPHFQSVSESCWIA